MNEINVHIVPGIGRQGGVFIMPALRSFAETDLGRPIFEENGKRVTLALGEVIGDANAFYPDLDISEDLAVDDNVDTRPAVTLYLLNNAQKYCALLFQDDVYALKITTACCFLRHEEHAYQSFPAGDYVVVYGS